jgi:Sodium/hydrogen exchanger family
MLAHGLGTAAKLLGQPAVVGEIIAGVLVEPTLFGGAIANAVFPADVRPLLSALANVGVALFMFVMGLGMDQSYDGTTTAINPALPPPRPTRRSSQLPGSPNKLTVPFASQPIMTRQTSTPWNRSSRAGVGNGRGALRFQNMVRLIPREQVW